MDESENKTSLETAQHSVRKTKVVNNTISFVLGFDSTAAGHKILHPEIHALPITIHPLHQASLIQPSSVSTD